MLNLNDVQVFYGDTPAVHQASVSVEEGEIVAIVGANGAGKTTLLKTIAGLIEPAQGTIEFLGQRIDHRPPYEITKLGVSYVPEERRVFGKLSVRDNLELGAYTESDLEKSAAKMEDIYDLFPVLQERADKKAETLSGGEQQMLAIGRSLIASPKLMMLDEPSLGLMPEYVDSVFDTIKQIHQQGLTVLLVEQDVQRSLELADRGYVFQTGQIKVEAPADELLESELVQSAFLGL